ncbi:MAG TPA: hypothetical protein VGF25_15175 [Thermoleophilaceae bacterium]
MGVHAPFGVPDPLHLSEGVHELAAVHALEQLAARLAVAVLAGQRAAVLHDEVGGVVEEAAPLADPAGALQVEVDPAMGAAVAEVPVHRRAVLVAPEQALEAAQVGAEPFGRHGGVLPSLPVVGLERVVGGRAEAALAHVPELALVRRAVEQLHVRRVRLATQRLDARLGALVRLLGRLAAELREQPTVAVREHPDLLGVHAERLHVADQHVVEALEAGRAELEDLRHVVGGVEHVGIPADHERPRRRAVHEPERRLEHGHQRALAAHERAADVEALLREQPVEPVARHSPRDVREPLADERRVVVAQVAHPGVDLAAPAALADDRVQLLRARRPHAQAQAVVGQHLHLHQVVGGAAGHDRVGAAGVVADHAAEGRVLVRGRVGGKRELVALLGHVRELVVDHAGLHARGAPLRIDVEDPAQELGVVDHDRHVAGLARQARAAAAGEHGRAVLAAGRERRHHVVRVPRQHHADRDLSVVRGVVRVDAAVSAVEVHLAAQLALERPLQRLDVHPLHALRRQLLVAEELRVAPARDGHAA